MTATNPILTLETTKGPIEIELFVDQTPAMAQNFLSHAEAGNYDGVMFHRVIDGFMIQTGDYQNGDGTGGEAFGGGELNDEIVEGLSNARGTLSMANRGTQCTHAETENIGPIPPNQAVPAQYLAQLGLDQSDPRFTCAGTNGSQFFVNQVDNTYLDGKHSVFARVLTGLDVVDAIAGAPANGNNKPNEDIKIELITVQ